MDDRNDADGMADTVGDDERTDYTDKTDGTDAHTECTDDENARYTAGTDNESSHRDRTYEEESCYDDGTHEGGMMIDHYGDDDDPPANDSVWAGCLGCDINEGSFDDSIRDSHFSSLASLVTMDESTLVTTGESTLATVDKLATADDTKETRAQDSNESTASKRPPPARALAVLASARRSCSGERTFLPLSTFVCKEGRRARAARQEGIQCHSWLVRPARRGRMKVTELILIFDFYPKKHGVQS